MNVEHYLINKIIINIKESESKNHLHFALNFANYKKRAFN